MCSATLMSYKGANVFSLEHHLQDDSLEIVYVTSKSRPVFRGAFGALNPPPQKSGWVYLFTE